MMYVMDGGAGKIVGLKYDPVNGNMSVAWRTNQSTLAFLSLIGPADQRVLVGTNMHPGTTISQMTNNPPPAYTEQVQWRDPPLASYLHLRLLQWYVCWRSPSSGLRRSPVLHDP